MATWSDGMMSANGINIHYYRTCGSDDPKPAMLLLHGMADNGLCWTRVARALEDRYDIVMPDARGHGHSDPLTVTLTADLLADDAAGVIQGLGLEKPVVFGHSMGGITAVVLAAHYPELVGALLLEDPPLRDQDIYRPPEVIEARRSEFAALREMSPEARTAHGAQQNPGWHLLEVEPWTQSKIEVDPAVLDVFGAFDTYSWRDAFARIQCPGLLLMGDPEKSIVTQQSAAEAVGLWQNGEVVQIADAGHCIRRDRFEETMAAVNAFLARQRV